MDQVGNPVDQDWSLRFHDMLLVIGVESTAADCASGGDAAESV
jgi:hypothetical protein